jgi:3-deoxy-manno-octulosonate cytidylyltransferase (CMP-KDO synthetase)
MKVVGIIPARYASSRFPGKPLIDLKGKSMIQRVYEGALKATNLTEVIVATDDKRIFDHVLSFGGNVRMTNENHPSGTDRCGEVALNIEADVIINIQGDEPLIDSRQIDQVIAAFTDSGVQIATLGTHSITPEDVQNTNRIKIVTDKKNNALYFSRSAIPNSANFKGVPEEFYPFYKHIGLYAYRKDCLLELVKLEPTKLEQIESLEQLRWLYNGYSIRVVTTDIETPNIDVPEDVEKVLPFL